MSHVGLLRRREMGGSAPASSYLVYHWEASDGLTNNTWVDRVSGKVLSKTGSPTTTTIDNNVYFGVNSSHYFSLDLNDAINGLTLGSEWKVELECLEYTPSGSNAIWFLDFGSNTNATHAFGFFHGLSTNWGFNTKLTGNSTGTTYGPSINNETNYGVLKKITLGIEKYDSTQYIVYAQLNDGVKNYGPNPVSKTGATFDKNFNTHTWYVGKPTTGNNNSALRYIKSIKIYSYA